MDPRVQKYVDELGLIPAANQEAYPNIMSDGKTCIGILCDPDALMAWNTYTSSYKPMPTCPAFILLIEEDLPPCD